ncbi:hypothetical protein [Pseudonocardia sp. WMMC193]|uniref:hypothetical protein n=1 Tax=Pseudonocardia sp. WMMC193 TaxID=2911965 RepID=UPI001F2FC664|nr:hypothetical protein [Pseudonocardia sp. WMMC193]MCF7547620.1 hypothetical protein [Pseudonocardia sp. WMMC193]
MVFVAPPSGSVRVDASSSVAPNTAGASAYYAPEVRTGNTVGSGTVVLAAADINAVGLTVTANGQGVDASRNTLVTGLTRVPSTTCVACTGPQPEPGSSRGSGSP